MVLQLEIIQDLFLLSIFTNILESLKLKLWLVSKLCLTYAFFVLKFF